MLQREIGTTFSDLWYRVAPTRPRLSPHAQIVRQHYGPQVSYVVEDPAGGNYYRITEAAYFFVGGLDGTRTVEEAWDACNAQLGDAAPTQKQCIDVLSKLQHHGLLMGELPLAPDMVLERKVQARKRRSEKRTGKWLFYSLPVLNPEPWLARHERLIRLICSRWGAAVWALVVGVAAALLIAHGGRFWSGLNAAGLMNPQNLAWMGVVFLALRALHELGHAVACKGFGGRVTEIGVILIALVLPLPYCDATSSWRFPSIRHRVLVSAGGVLAETFVAAIAAIVWVFVEPGALSSICYNVMIVSGLTTLFFNLNPLLRYDGYYILSDIAGSPNLAHRSKELWKAGLHRWAFGVRALQPPPVRGGGEAGLLWVYSALSVPYRLFVMFAIILVLFHIAPTIGVILGVLMICVVAVWPVLKGIGYLASSPMLVGHRPRAVAVVAGFLAVVGGVLGLVPVRAAAYAPGIVEPAVSAPVRAGESGFIRAVIADPDRPLAAGETLVELDNLETTTLLAVAVTNVEKARAVLRKAREISPAEEEVARSDLDAALAELRRVGDRAAALRISAPAAGRFVAADVASPDLGNALGRFVQRGEMLGYIQATDDLVVRVLVSDSEYSRLKVAGASVTPGGEARPRGVELKVRGLADATIPARIVRDVAVGSRDLVESALSAPAGGSILVDPSDPKGRRTLRPHFFIEIRPDEGAKLPPAAQPGLRTQVRFALPPEPLLTQWLRHVRQYIRGHLG